MLADRLYPLDQVSLGINLLQAAGGHQALQDANLFQRFGTGIWLGIFGFPSRVAGGFYRLYEQMCACQ